MTKPNWIAVEYRGKDLTIWFMQDSHVLQTKDLALPDGDAHPETLLQDIQAEVQSAVPVPMVICDHTGILQDALQLLAQTVPCKPADLEAAPVLPIVEQVRILPALRQTAPSDMMQGADCVIAGVLAQEADFDGILCLPGQQTRWVHISAGEIVSFRTFVTGEMFDHLLSASNVTGEGEDWAAFDDALTETLSRPADLAARLFSVRADMRFDGLAAPSARARMLGLLIGAELAAARPYWLGQAVIVVGDDALAQAYGRGLRSQGGMSRQIPAKGLVLQGMIASYRNRAPDNSDITQA